MNSTVHAHTHTKLCKDMSEVLVAVVYGGLKLVFQIMQSLTDEFTALRQLCCFSAQILRHKNTPIKPAKHPLLLAHISSCSSMALICW